MAVGTALAIGGAALGIAGNISEARSAKKASEFNAAQLEQQAVHVEMDSRRKSTAMQENNRRTLASIRARFAKSGLDFVGTPVEVMAEKKFLLDQEIREEKLAASSEARRLRSGAAETIQQGKNAYRGGMISSIGRGFSFGSSMFGGTGGVGAGLGPQQGITQTWQGTPQINAAGIA